MDRRITRNNTAKLSHYSYKWSPSKQQEGPKQNIRHRTRSHQDPLATPHGSALRGGGFPRRHVTEGELDNSSLIKGDSRRVSRLISSEVAPKTGERAAEVLLPKKEKKAKRRRREEKGSRMINNMEQAGRMAATRPWMNEGTP